MTKTELPTYVPADATDDVPCPLCSGATIPPNPNPAFGELGWYCEDCARASDGQGNLYI